MIHRLIVPLLPGEDPDPEDVHVRLDPAWRVSIIWHGDHAEVIAEGEVPSQRAIAEAFDLARSSAIVRKAAEAERSARAMVDAVVRAREAERLAAVEQDPDVRAALLRIASDGAPSPSSA